MRLITGLLLSAFLPLVSAQRLRDQIAETKTKEEAIKTTLTNFIARKNRLPCPAIATLIETSPAYGREADPTSVPPCAGTDNIGGAAVRGIVPWIALGLEDEGAEDGSTYQVTTAAMLLTSSTVAGMRGNMDIHSATPVSAANLLNPNNPAVL